MNSWLWCVALVSLACSSGPAPAASGGGSGSAGSEATAAGNASAAGMAGGGAAGASGGVAPGGQAGAVAAGGGGASAGQGGGVGQSGMEPVGEPAIGWLGRVETTAEGARFSWPGTGFSARFDGTGVKVSLKTNAVDYFQLVIDQQVSLLTTEPGQHDYELATDLPSGVHAVTLWRRTEANAGSVELGGLAFRGNLLAPSTSSKRLEVVGDSISVGFGVECQTQNEPFSYATENNYQTYQAVAARALGAELVTLAWSGIGMWRDVNGSTEAASNMPARYLRTLGNEAASVWDFARYTPGAVVVHLGTNDFAKGDPGQPFVDAYTSFVAAVRGRYPQARLYLAVSPMLGGERRAALKGYLAEVHSARVSAGDQNVVVLEFAEPAAGAWGCGHPNGATHLVMAAALEQALRQDLGW